MAESWHTDGVVVALMQRFQTQRLPRAIELKKKVDKGEMLNDYDLQYLQRVERRQQATRRHPAPLPGSPAYRRQGQRVVRRNNTEGRRERRKSVLNTHCEDRGIRIVSADGPDAADNSHGVTMLNQNSNVSIKPISSANFCGLPST